MLCHGNAPASVRPPRIRAKYCLHRAQVHAAKCHDAQQDVCAHTHILTLTIRQARREHAHPELRAHTDMHGHTKKCNACRLSMHN